MTDYSELVKALRCCGSTSADCTVCPWDKYTFGMCAEKLLMDAAAAIEELQAEVDKWTHNATLEQSKAIANFESYCKLKEQMPKRGERTINPYESTWAIENGYI